MLEAHPEAKPPGDTSRPEDPQVGTDLGKTAEPSREDGRAEELLRLQWQVAWLHRQLRRQEARWCAAFHHLQMQINALLKRQDRGPRGGRGAAELRGPDAGRIPTASLQWRTQSDTQVSKSTFGTMSPLSADEEITPKRAGRKSHSVPLRGQGLSPESAPSPQSVSIKIERIDSGKIVTREDEDKTLSISLRVRGAASARSGLRAEGRPAPLGGGKAATSPRRTLPTSSGRKPTGPAACAVPLTEDGPTAQDIDARPSPSEGPDSKALTRAQMDGLAGPSADTQPQRPPEAAAALSLQNPPVEPESSQPTGTGTGKEGKEEETQSLGNEVDEAACAGHEAVSTPKGPEKDTGAKSTVLHFLNGDTQRTLPDQTVVYYCAGAQTTRTTHPSGLTVVRFPDKRTEKFYPDGSKETLFPDGTVKRLSDGREETMFPDGTAVSMERNGDRTIVFSNGQRDIHTAQFKRREYPDGTVKTVYSSGLQETKYASGRVRVRHETGSIVLDQKQVVLHSQ